MNGHSSDHICLKQRLQLGGKYEQKIAVLNLFENSDVDIHLQDWIFFFEKRMSTVDTL